MTSERTLVARRYWFAESEALAAIRDAEDAPNWEASNLPVTIFCLDADVHAAVSQLPEDQSVRIVDMRNGPSLGVALSAELDRERARYLQFAFHAVEDFAPAIELMCEQLGPSEAKAVRTAMLPVTAFGVGEPETETSYISERHWIKTAHLRKALNIADIETPSDLHAQIVAIVADTACDELSLITGAYYLSSSEQPVLSAAQREAALWRAWAARAMSEIELLKSEKRVRSGREAALKARHERDLARQAERSRKEIDRLHRAAGWAGRWRSRLPGLFGRR
jgi:hypothetical protein